MRCPAYLLPSAVVFVVVSLALTGCNSAVAPRDTTVAITGSAIQGKVFGGQQPITGATIQLYSVNLTTDGGAATPLLTTTVTTSDGTGAANTNANTGNANNTFAPGNFTITGDYICPTADTLVYLTATSGNPGLVAGTNNTASAIMAALGTCSNLKNNVQFINVNELTTVGAVAALYPYMMSYTAVGSTPAHASDLANGFNVASEYVNFQTGSAPGLNLPSGYDASTTAVNTLADVIAACVNTGGGMPTDGTICGHLFDYTKPAASAAATETIGALIDILKQPTQNVTQIFNLQSNIVPFQPTMATAPSDWTLPILPIPGAPVFSVAGGSYSTAQTVTITDSDATAVLYYTTDGSTPTTSSSVSSSALTISTTTTLKALAVESGRIASAVSSATYNITVSPTVSVSPVTVPSGSTSPVSLTATSNANGSVVTFGVTGTATGSFSPATCTIASGTCSVSYIPTGALAAGTYPNNITASFAAISSYNAAAATSTLTVATIAPTVSLSSPTIMYNGSDQQVTLTASSNATGTVVSFSSGGVNGYFNSGARCTVGSSGSCWTTFIVGGDNTPRTRNNAFFASFSAVGGYSAASATDTLTITTAPTVSLSGVTTSYGSTTPVAVTASSNTDGSVVTFGVTGTATGSFSPATCTVASGTCSVNYIPTGTLAVGTYPNNITASFAASSYYNAAAATSTLTVSALAPTVSLSAVTNSYGSTTPVAVTASSNANGSVVTFGVTGTATGSFSPATCTIASGTCSVNYIPTGTLAAGTYPNDITASFAAISSYNAVTATSTLTVTTVAPTVSLNDVTITYNGSDQFVTLTASSNANGSQVNFTYNHSISGYFTSSPSCTVSMGSCSKTFDVGPGNGPRPYQNAFTASFGAVGNYSAASATDTLRIN